MTAALRDALRQAGRFVAADQARFTSTWQGQPEWAETGPALRGNDLIWRRITRSKPYIYVELGTRVRYATMTPDFTAKTQPRVIDSGPGSGGVLFVNKQRPRPGIEARHSNEVIARSAERYLPEIMSAAIKRVR
jgi:hypothetical protein